MRVALYARVSTEAQEVRGTIGSQLEALRARMAEEGHQVVATYLDDGYSGARLDRPGLDALRDGAEGGLFETVWCLSPDRLARSYAYQVVILDELRRHRVEVRFTDAPSLSDDPQARLLTQVQGVIAEYERAKITERYRRGKLYRSRLGEVISWKASYGYRRVPRSPEGPARLEVFEPEADVVRRIFSAYVSEGHSTRQIVRNLAEERIPSPTGKAVWGTSTVSRILRNEAYVGRVYYNRTELVPAPPGKGRHPYRQRPRSREEWIEIPCPPVVDEEVFEAAQHVSRDNSRWSPRNVGAEAWLLRGLVICGSCGVGTNCHKMRGRNGTHHRYYYCRNHDPIRAGGEDRRCPERNIRADELDAFVFEQVRDVLSRPEVLLTAEHALAGSAGTDDELLETQLGRLDRKLESASAERRRLLDLYQTSLIELPELQRRMKEIDLRHGTLKKERANLVAQRRELAQDNRLRSRVEDFAQRARQGLDHLDFDGRQRLLRFILEEVRVSGWNVELRFRIPLDEPPPDGPTLQPRLNSPNKLREGLDNLDVFHPSLSGGLTT